MFLSVAIPGTGMTSTANSVLSPELWRCAVDLCLLGPMLSACTAQWQKPEPIDQVDFSCYAVCESKDRVHVIVAVPTREETERLFGALLYRESIQPAWIEVDKRSDHDYRVMKTGIDPSFFSPLEAS